MTDVKSFYDIVQKLYVFLSASNKRWEILNNFILQTFNKKPRQKVTRNKDSERKKDAAFKKTEAALASNSVGQKKPTKVTTLKKVCPTRWSSRHDAIKSLRHNYSDIMKMLNKINLTSSKADERAEAAGLINAIQKYEFSIQIVLQDKLLSSIDAVSQYSVHAKRKHEAFLRHHFF